MFEKIDYLFKNKIDLGIYTIVKVEKSKSIFGYELYYEGYMFYVIYNDEYLIDLCYSKTFFDTFKNEIQIISRKIKIQKLLNV